MLVRLQDTIRDTIFVEIVVDDLLGVCLGKHKSTILPPSMIRKARSQDSYLLLVIHEVKYAFTVEQEVSAGRSKGEY